MQCIQEHHCPHIENTSESWDGIDGDYNRNFEGCILKLVEANTSLPINLKKKKNPEGTRSLKEMK